MLTYYNLCWHAEQKRRFDKIFFKSSTKNSQPDASKWMNKRGGQERSNSSIQRIVLALLQIREILRDSDGYAQTTVDLVVAN